ncbi:MAG TPA: ribosome recycling factor [Candidatus Magasanikbacteria bacterium]|nr:ribosome recycling factor [Candidatus Magasanikbacteria bacterium]
MSFTEASQSRFVAALDHLKHEIAQLRTGRAHPALVENITVEAYGQKQPLKALAGISVPDAQTLVVQPWDKSIAQAVEKAIRESGTNLNPVSEGVLVRVPIPTLTEERRREIVKVLHQKLEEGRIQVRTLRDDVKNAILRAEKNKEMGEDERYVEQEKLDKLVKEYNEKIKQIGEEKEADIMRI